MTTDPSGFPTDRASEVKKPRRRTWRTWLVVGLAAIVVLSGVGVGTYFLLRPASTSATRTFTRDVQVTKGDQTQTVSLEGTLSPRKQSDVNFSVAGTVTTVKVKAGDKVTKGQKLAGVDDSSLQNAVDLAEANLASAKANRTEIYDNKGSSAAKKSATAQVTSAQAALTNAEDDLKAAVLRSPITGTVASVNVEVGDTVGSSTGGSATSGASGSSSSSTTTAAFVIIQTASWKVEGSIGAADLANVKAGQKVAVTTDASSDALSGTVASVGIVATSTSDNGTATFPVEINLTGNHTNLYSGTTATAVITVGSYPDVLTVPTAAIRSEGDKTVVTKVNNSQTSTVEVEVGKVFGSATQITKGLSEGDTVRISFTRSATASSSSNEGGFGFGGGGLGGGLEGGGPGGGAPPGVSGGRTTGR
ncbi:macrolide-specific efflux system membrane fusion protein [Propionicimonas paludicola]|uniref:Macrolide-specific efflux system membrane fusion protein n=1 Tax=Propionicimonas paludicola TaxID=185243 RepID=A0A2A9CUE9_9ACTN|nr:HlyD family efflux transporter periplasmic adaptor subunit [Propionicimonas paludicola]PFG17272.1 macrolide-specific efflux system membrane fusion protein [Propionicimonas paludicola]